MRVGNRVKHIFSFSFTNRRPNRSMWKEKSPVTATDDDSSYSNDSDSDDAIHISEDEGSDPSDVDVDDDDDYTTSTSKRVRIISWRLDNSKMVPGRCRWTLEQEKRLQAAQQQLARCQKAWSSEQEVWLKHVCSCPLLLHTWLLGTSFYMLHGKHVNTYMECRSKSCTKKKQRMRTLYISARNNNRMNGCISGKR